MHPEKLWSGAILIHLDDDFAIIKGFIPESCPLYSDRWYWTYKQLFYDKQDYILREGVVERGLLWTATYALCADDEWLRDHMKMSGDFCGFRPYWRGSDVIGSGTRTYKKRRNRRGCISGGALLMLKISKEGYWPCIFKKYWGCKSLNHFTKQNYCIYLNSTTKGNHNWKEMQARKWKRNMALRMRHCTECRRRAVGQAAAWGLPCRMLHLCCFAVPRRNRGLRQPSYHVSGELLGIIQTINWNRYYEEVTVARLANIS